MKTKVVNISDIKSAIKMKGPLGTIIGAISMRVLGFCEINSLYSQFSQYRGREFTEEALKTFNVKYDVKVEELDYIPQSGPFIVVSNHPFGGFDGVILFSVISSIRPDFKILSNFILSHIENLKDNFLPVNPFSRKKGLKKSFIGLRAARELVNNGGALGLFPAGEVSTYYKGHTHTADKEWQPAMIKLIKSSNVPVVPVYFDGTNSKFFHFLGKIHPLLRTLRLPRELLTKIGKTLVLRLGKPILPSELAEFSDLKELGKYLRNRTYALEANVPKERVIPKISSDKAVSIALPQNNDKLVKEIKKLEKNSLLFTVSNYQCFLANYEDIPSLIYQIGRKREESFRAVGEGSNLELDLDEFDKYYKHLILWDFQKKNLVGAYRLGIGSEIMKEYGIDGFYTHSLFSFSKKFSKTLSHSIELGRSFVSVEYKKENLPLMLLIKGLLYSVLKYKKCRFLIGPASISNWYSPFYKSLIVYYLKQYNSLEGKGRKVRARHPFVPSSLRVDLDSLLSNKTDNVDKFDRYLLKLSDGQYRLPTLIKKYIKLRAKFLSFNVDKNFNYCVDGFVFMDLQDLPLEELAILTKGCTEEERAIILERFNQGTGS